jgi:hypothetical protein
MLTTFALWLVSALIGMAVAWTVGCQGSGIAISLVPGRVRDGVFAWRRGLGQYGKSSFPAGRSLPVATTRVAASGPRRWMTVRRDALGRRGESGGGPLAYLDDPRGWTVLVGAGLSR